MDLEQAVGMLGSWDTTLGLRVLGAAAVAVGIHALHRVHRARAGAAPAARGPLRAPGTDEAYLDSQKDQDEQQAAADTHSKGAAGPGAEEQLPAGVAAGAAQPAAAAEVAGEGATAEVAVPGAGAVAVEHPVHPSSSLPAPAEEQQEAAAGGGGGGAAALLQPAEQAVSDPSDVPPAGLGSPFVPPALSLPPVADDAALGPPAGSGGTAGSIPLFSSFVTQQPQQQEEQDQQQQQQQLPSVFGSNFDLEAAASAAGSGSGGSPPVQPLHRRRRSLLSEGLDQQMDQATAAALAADPEGQRLLAEEQRLMAELAALEEPTGADATVAAAAAGTAPGGRPGLRVELPFDPFEQDRAAQQAQRGVAAQRQGTPPSAPASPLAAPASPLGYLQHQHRDQEAQAAAAAASAAAWAASQQQQQHQLQAGLVGTSAAGHGHGAGDSVANALQRAAERAASSSGGSMAAHGGGGPGGYGYHHQHHQQQLLHPAPRTGLTGNTFRSSTLSSPIHLPPPPMPGSDSAWGAGFSMLSERSSSRSGGGGDLPMPRLSEEVEGMRMSMDVDVPLACKLDVVAGPGSGRGYTNTEEVLEIVIGRNQGATMQLNDGEISGQHAAVRWSSVDKCWKVADLGSLNGTLLNGEAISVAGRKRGRDYRLSTDDILQLGSFTKIKVSTFPRDLLDPMQSRCGSLPVGSMPKSLTMPKHRIPSFSSLLSPKITNTPSKKATVAAASDELRLECCIVSRTGRDHQRKGQTCEDVACAECPLHGSEEALGGNPAALFCVFDGHCGRGAADAASVALPDAVSTRLKGVHEALQAAAGAEDMLHKAFLATDETISAEEGCTATAVLMWRDGSGAVCLQAANVGDSAAFFIDPSTGEALELTEDHRLTNPRERQRLQDMGIQLASNARRLYGLNLCRGLGDKFLKDEDLGLSAEPHVSGVVRLTEEQGGILLIASDGLWDVAEADAVVQAICQADREKDGSVLEITNAVIAHALKQRTKDDVTALVVRVWPGSEWELRSPTKNLDDGQVAAFVS